MAKESMTAADFLAELTQRVAAGDVQLVREPRLQGGAHLPSAQESAFETAIYPQNAEATAWLRGTGEQINRTGRVDPRPDDGFHGKWYMRRLANEQQTSVGELPHGTDAFGAHRPFAMPPLPEELRGAISPVASEDGQATQVLLLALPFGSLDAVTQALRNRGILARKPGAVADFGLRLLPEDGRAVMASALDRAFAASLLADPQNGLEDWSRPTLQRPFDPTRLPLEELMARAGPHLSPPQREEEAAPSKDEPESPEPAALQPLPSLRSQGEAIRALNPELRAEPLLNGSERLWLVLDQGDRRAFTHADLVQSPLKIGHEERDLERPRFPISAEEAQRLENTIGAVPRGALLPLNVNPLAKIFSPRRLSGIKGRESLIGHAVFAHLRNEDPAAEGYYCYLSSEDEARLSSVRERLQLPTAAQAHLTHEEERPFLLRLQLPRATWLALRARAEQDAAKEGDASRRGLAVGELSGYSLQALNEEARERCGVRRPTPGTVVSLRPAARKEKLSGADAESLLLGEIEAFDPERMLSAHIHRERKGEGGHDEPTIFLRGPVQALNQLSAKLSRETTTFGRDSEIRLIDGNRQRGGETGVLEIVASPNILSALRARGVDHVSDDTQEGLHTDHYKSRIVALFQSREREVKGHDAIESAMRHLSALELRRVDVSAPDRTRLDGLRREIGQLTQMHTTLAEPVRELERQQKSLHASLKKIKALGGDAAVRDMIQARLRTLRNTEREMSALPAQLGHRLRQLEADHQRLEAAGTRTDLLALDADPRSLRLLAPLIPAQLPRVTALKPGLLHLAASPELLQSLSRRGREMKWVERQVPLDQLAAEAMALQHAFLAERQQDHSEKRRIEEEEQEEDERLSTAPGPRELQSPSAPNAVRQARTALRSLSGFLAYERPESEYPDFPAEAPLEPRPVLMLSVHRQAELQSAIRLHQALGDAGMLDPEPRFYGHLLPNSHAKAPAANFSLASPVESETAKPESWSILRAAIKEVLFDGRKAAQGESYSASRLGDSLSQLAKTWHGLAEGDAAVSLAMTQLARQARRAGFDIAEWGRTPTASPAGQELAAMLQALGGLDDEIGKHLRREREAAPDPAPRPTPSKASRTDCFVPVISGPAEFYPVDGTSGSPREASQLPVWRHIISARGQRQGEGRAIPAVKLYLSPEALPWLAPLIADQRGEGRIEDLTARPLSQEILSTRIDNLIMRHIGLSGSARG